jgi:autotransporter-associated beta strand protein
MKAIRPTIVRRLASLNVALLLLGAVQNAPKVEAATQWWGGTSADAWTAAKWGTSSAGPFATAWTSGNIAQFDAASSTIKGATTAFSGINANENVTVTAAGTLNTGGAQATVTVATGKTFDFNGQSLGTATGTGIIKAGDGTVAMGGASLYPGGFTLNAGTVTIGGVNSLGVGPLTINGGTLQANSGVARDLSGKPSSITIGGNFAFGGTGVLTFNGATSLGSAVRTITHNGTAAVNWNGIISGTAGNGLVKAGTGTLVLGGASTFDGAITINNGIVNFTALNNLGGGTAINFGGGTLQWASANTTDISTRTVTLGTGGGTLDVQANIVALANAIGNNGAGGLTVKSTSAGSITLGGVNTYSGDTTVGSATTLQVSSDANLGSGANITINQNGDLKTTGSFTTSKNIILTGGNPVIENGTGTFTVNGQVGGTSLTPIKQGSGALTLNAAGSFAGGTSLLLLKAGKLNLGHPAALNGTTLKFNPAGSSLDNTWTGGAMALTGFLGLDMTSGFTFVGTDDLDLSAGQAGFVQTSGSTRTITVTAKTLKLTGILCSGTSAAGATRVDGALTKDGAGTLILSSPSDYTLGTTLNTGTLDVSHASALGTGTFTIAGGTIDNSSAGAIVIANNNPQAWNGDFAFKGTKALDLGTGAVTLGGNRSIGVGGGSAGSNPLTVGGVIGDGGNGYGLSVDISAAGKLVLSGLNTFSGQIAYGRGTLSVNTIANIGVPSSLGTGSANSVIRLGNNNMTGTLQYTGGATSTDRQVQIASGAVNGIGGAAIKNDGTGALVFTAANFNSPFNTATSSRNLALGGTSTDNNTIQGVIADNNFSSGGILTVSKSDTGKWILSGANTYSGGTTLSGGTLEIGASGSIKGNVNITGSVLRLDNNTALENTATLTLPASPAAGTVDLSFSGTQMINALVFGSSPQPAGTWGSLTSSAYHKDAAFSGNGLLQIGNNNSPVAYNIGPVSAVSGVALRLEIIGGKAPPTDVDSGDTLKVYSVQNPTANGGTAVIAEGGATILYTAPSGQTSDSFTFTVDDGKSVSAPATVSVNVSSYTGQYSANYVTGSGHFQSGSWVMQFRGIPNVTYGIERAPSVSGPWTRLSPDVTADGIGLISVSDADGGSSSFYRTVYP